MGSRANGPSIEHRDAWVEIDRDAIVANARALAALCGGSTRIAPVVKADAYGHGAIAVARALTGHGFGPLCVATVDEGLALRAAGINDDIIVLYAAPHRALPAAAAARLQLTLGDAAGVRWVAGLPAAERRGLALQLKIDTGMTRQGVRLEELAALRTALTAIAEGVRGVWTHFADGANADGTAIQLRRFDEAVDVLRGVGIRSPRHVAGSAAILAGVGRKYELARPGMAMYGAVPVEFEMRLGSPPIALRPAMAVRARPARLVTVPAGTPVGYSSTFITTGPTVVATLPLGYADGLRRSLGNGRTQVLVEGARAALIGRVSMDSCAVDVTAIANVSTDSVFTLLGTDGSAVITLEALSQDAGTIPQELAVGFAARLPYVYR